MARQKRFLKLIKEYTAGPPRTNFAIGDVFVFDPGYASTDCWKGLSPSEQEVIKSWIDSGQNIRIVGMADPDKHQHIPSKQPKQPLLVLALDEGGQRWGVDRIAVDSCTGTRDITQYPNLAKIPDSWRYDNKVQIKPKEFEQDEENQSNTSFDGDKTRPTEFDTKKKNVKIPSKGEKHTPEVGSTGRIDYMKGVK